MRTTVYNHHGEDVHVQPHLKGRHREHCLCYGCSKFTPAGEPGERCSIADDVFVNCQKHGIVSPIWECPNFEPKEA